MEWPNKHSSINLILMYFCLSKGVGPHELMCHLKGSHDARDALVSPTVHQGSVVNLYDQISYPVHIGHLAAQANK